MKTPSISFLFASGRFLIFPGMIESLSKGLCFVVWPNLFYKTKIPSILCLLDADDAFDKPAVFPLYFDFN